MIVAIGDSLSDLTSSANVEVEDNDADEETAQIQLSEDDEPGWVTGTMTKMVQQQMERFL